MKYSVNLYLKAKKKWEKINTLLDEIVEIDRAERRTEEEISSIARQLLKNISGKTIRTLIQMGSRREFIVFGKRGFGVVSDFYTKGKYSAQTEEVIDFLGENKSAYKKILPYIKKKDKKEILAAFIQNRKNEKKDEFIFNLPKPKMVIFPENRDNPLEITSIKMRRRELYAHSKNGSSISLDEDDISTNMTKEQLYLPCWKLLIKAKRHALKGKRETEKRLAKIKKEVESYWFAHKLATAMEERP